MEQVESLDFVEEAQAPAAPLIEARDELHILPLSSVPLQTASLRRARLIKNVQLDSMIEFYHDATTGSGQVAPSDLGRHLGLTEIPPHPDLVTVVELARLSSYDVYSLRIELRRLQIPVRDVSALQLSEGAKKELTSYMRFFTAPLVREIYGSTDIAVDGIDQLIQLFRSPDREQALKNLRLFANRLKIEPAEVPRFLEDYGDVFLSLAYFQQRLDRVVPQIHAFVKSSRELQQHFQLSRDRRFMGAATYLDQKLNDIVSSITGRFESFNRHTADMWQSINAERFRKVRDLITSHHTTVGGILCGLSVKMDLWDRKFSRRQDGGAVVSRAEFIMSEMRPGIEKLERIEARGLKITDFNN